MNIRPYHIFLAVSFAIVALLIKTLPQTPQTAEENQEETQRKQDSDPKILESRKQFNENVGNIFVKNSSGIIQQCDIDSTKIHTSYCVYVKIYLKSIPYNLKPLLEVVCEQIHSIYKSGVEITSYIGDRKISDCNWNISDNTVQTKLYI